MAYRVIKWPDRTLELSVIDLADRLAVEGYSSFEWTDPPGTIYPPHSHTDDQSHWLISGHLRLEVDGYGTVDLLPGDRDIMPAGTVHSARVVGTEPAVYLIGSKTK